MPRWHRMAQRGKARGKRRGYRNGFYRRICYIANDQGRHLGRWDYTISTMRRCAADEADADDHSDRHLGGWAHAPSAPPGRRSEASQGFTFFSARIMFRCGASSENPTVFPMQELEREIPDELAALSRLASVHGRWRANEAPTAQQGINPKEAIERFRLAEATQQPPDVSTFSWQGPIC